MAAIVPVQKYTVEDFVSVDLEGSKVVLTLFHGNIQVGTPGWANQMELNYEQAKMLADNLLRYAEIVKSKE